MNPPRILIAGIGNVFFGDDAFGVEVLHRLSRLPLPNHVRAVDFGIRGFDLACALLEGYESVLLVDATSRGGRPGELYVIELDVAAITANGNPPLVTGHSLNLVEVIHLVRAMGGPLPRLWLVGCEPAALGSADEPRMGLSPAVAEAVELALPLIDSLLQRLDEAVVSVSQPSSGSA